MADDVVDYELTDEQVNDLLSNLILRDFTDLQIETWASGATDLAAVQQRFEQVGTELRNIEQVLEKVLYGVGGI